MLNGATAEVMTNPMDGVWIFARYLTSPRRPFSGGFGRDVFRPGHFGGLKAGLSWICPIKL